MQSVNQFLFRCDYLFFTKPINEVKVEPAYANAGMGFDMGCRRSIYNSRLPVRNVIS